MNEINGACELSIVMPCLNEVETLGVCIDKAKNFINTNNVSAEIVIADNGSTDGSIDLAREKGARVIHVKSRGYGAALMGGIEAALGRYAIMADADDSYDFTRLEPFLEKLRSGYDLVMGNRFKGGIKPGAMPALHRYLGNPVLSGVGRLFFHSPVYDFHCGLRGFRVKSILDLNLQTTGMEYASEMVVKATLHKLKITEVPTTLSPDGRTRAPHLRSWRDGWRHLRFLLIFSPRWLFLYPGLALIVLGILIMSLLMPGPMTYYGVTFDIHTMLYASMAVILGLQGVSFALFSKVFAIGIRLIPEDRRITRLIEYISLERGLVLGGILSFVGFIGTVYAVAKWSTVSFGPLVPTSVMRIAIPSLTALAAGVQVVLGSFFLSVLRLGHK